ncbi:MAG: DUF86 domain-containing protein [Bryobacteraceae bacterium]
MPSDAAAVLRDIERHIDLADQFIADLDYEAFQADARTVYAVTRCLEIISEASRRLPDEMKARYSAIAWKNMAGLATSTVMTTRMLPRSCMGHRQTGLTALAGCCRPRD